MKDKILKLLYAYINDEDIILKEHCGAPYIKNIRERYCFSSFAVSHKKRYLSSLGSDSM